MIGRIGDKSGKLKQVKFCSIEIIVLLCSFSTYSQCNIDLGDDTVFCGSPYVLNAGSGFSSYLWQDGTTDSVITVNNSGLYFVEASNPGTELIINGDFESGNTGFNSDYTYATNLWSTGNYWVGYNANIVHPNFNGLGHSSPGSSMFLVVNGSTIPNTVVWSGTIIVDPGNIYELSLWVSALTPFSPAILEVFINGVLLPQIMQCPSQTNIWEEYTANWNSINDTIAIITIVNLNITSSGSDFGIDDMESMDIICL